MSDLLNTLIIPEGANDSQESFHSVSSQPSASAPTQSDPTAQASALQAAGVPTYDVDSYLADPANAALLASPLKPKKSTPRTPDKDLINPTEPVSLGSKTSHHVSALTTLCQTRGVQPVFEIEGEPSVPDFGGVLRIGETTIASEERWRSKKEAREALAEKGMEAVRNMEVKKKEPGTAKTPGETKNWVGMLLEYHNLIDPNLGPMYHYFALGSSYACVCTIPSLPDRPFGSSTTPFPNKKAAHANAAQEAVQHLISEGQLNPDGSTKSRKKVKLGTAVKLERKGLEVQKEASYAQKVNDIAPLLGLQAPQYVLGPASSLAPNMISGYATFGNEPGMKKEIGEARNIFGKKNAKEQVAKEVWDVLIELAEKRGVNVEEVHGKTTVQG